MIKGITAGIAAGLIALCVIGATGCGSSSEPEALTKAEFAQQGNQICAEAVRAREQVIKEIIERTDPKGNQEAAQAEMIQKGVPSYEKAAEQLDGLGAPKGEEEKVEGLVGAMEEAAERALADPHTAAISSVLFRKADKFAQELGLNECVI